MKNKAPRSGGPKNRLIVRVATSKKHDFFCGLENRLLKKVVGQITGC
jgi:hypothetical protein